MANGTVLPAFIRSEYDQSSQGFRDFERNAALAGENAKKQFERSFSEIQSVVQKALSIPRNAAGALDFDTANLRRAADDAQALATATREVARAAEIAAKSTGDTSESTRLYLQAARAAAAGAEQQSRELNAQAATYERLQKEIDQTASATQRLVKASDSYNIANRGVTESSKAVRQATVQAGQQLQDIVISLQGGQRASTVLAQQLPQLAFAFSGVGGKVGAVASVLSGPWGVAVALAAGALGGLIDNLFRTEDASGKLVLALDVQKNSYETLRRAVDEYNQSQRQTEELSYQAIKLAKEQSAENLRLAETELAVARARFETQAPTGKAGQELRSAYAADVIALEKRIAELRGLLAKDTSALVSKDAEAALDPVVAITRKWDEEIRNVNNAYTELAATRRLTQKEEEQWRNKEITFEKKKRAEIEAYRASERASKRTGGANPSGELTSFISPVTGGRITSTPGIRRDPVNGKQAQHNGIDIAVPIGTSVRAPAGGTVIESGVLPGYGNVVYIDHGAGTITRLAHLSKRNVQKGDVVERGDVIGLSGNSGKSTGPHLHWETRVNNRVVDPRGRQLATDPLGAAQRSERLMEQARRAAEQLQNGIDRAADSVERLRGRFDEAPRDVDVATAAVTDLNRAIEEADAKLKAGGLTDAQKATIQQTRDTAAQTRDQLIPAFLKRPIEDRIRDGDRELQLQRLVLAGREDEADVLALQFDVMRQLRVENEADLRTELEKRGITWDRYQILIKQREELITMQRAQDRLDRAVKSSGAKLRELDRAYETIVQGVADLPKKGIDGIKDIVNSIRRQANEIIARRIVDRIAGNLFQRLEDQIRGKKPIDAATQNYVRSTKEANAALIDITNGFRQAAAAFRGAANDNSPLSLGKTAGANSWLDEIIVRAKSGKEDGISSELKKLNKTTASGLGKEAPFLKGLSKQVGIALEGAFIGQSASSLILGKKGSSTGSAIGGALGKVAGEAIGKTLGGTLGKIAGPLGGIAGGLLGGALGGLFKKTPRGYATIGAGSDGGLAIIGSGGNSKSAQKAGMGAAGATLDALAQIADALGGTYDASKGSVSIGRSGDSWHVDTTGRGRLKKSQGGIDFDDDYEAAVRYATMDLIKDGVISGLKASTQRLLQNAKDLDAGLQKALDFESVFTRLKEYKDPVGAALDGLDKEFTRLKGIFKEAGASAEEYAQLEELYGLERAKAIEEVAKKVTASLKSLYDDLTLGDNGRSLRDRLSAAQAAYDPLKTRVLAGDQSAYDAFAEAAKQLLDVQRQFSGSQTPYFTLLNEITKITKDRIDAESNIVSIAQGRDSPFTSTGAKNDNYKPVTAAIEQQTSDLLNGIAKIVASGGGGGALGGGFTPRFL